MATGIHACSSPPRIATHIWMYQLRRVIQQFFLASPFSFNFHASQFYFEGFHFSLHCYVMCAASEVFKGHLDLPSPLADWQEALYCWCIWISLFPAVVSLLFLCTSPAHPGPTVFRQSPAMCPTPRCNTSSARAPWGERRCISSSEQVTGAGAALGWALLLLGTCAVQFKPYTCTLQQRKPTLYYLPTTGCSPWFSLCFGSL